ncbi:MAG: YhjD/YihY/BrkB family envelope integrity protein [Nocardioidaceae bacterium]
MPAWVNRLRERGRGVAVQARENVPGLSRLLADLARVGFVDRAMIIAAQGMLALVPLLIVLSAFLPTDVGTLTVHRFESVTGIQAAQMAIVHSGLERSQVRAQTGYAGLVLTILSATSFAMAVQRVYQLVWEQPRAGGIAASGRCVAWLVGWLAGLLMIAAVGTVAPHDLVWSTLAVLVQVVLASALWCWSAWMLLRGRVGWRKLAGGAVLTAAGISAYGAAAGLVMPRYAAGNVAEFGSIGLVLSVASWLVGFALVVVVAAVTGRVLTEDERVREAWADLRAWWRGRSRGRRRSRGSPGTDDPTASGRT